MSKHRSLQQKILQPLDNHFLLTYWVHSKGPRWSYTWYCFHRWQASPTNHEPHVEQSPEDPRIRCKLMSLKMPYRVHKSANQHIRRFIGIWTRGKHGEWNTRKLPQRYPPKNTSLPCMSFASCFSQNCACMNNEETCIIHQDRDKFTITTFPAKLIALFCHLQTPNWSNVVLEKSKRKNRPSTN